jgi:phenylacetate-coenzyme A ligase PaaK-like adenylate-forming protein
MFETGVRQLRMALAMVLGRRIEPRNVERLVADAVRTLTTFGTLGDEARELLDGPFADPEARRSFQEQALRRTVSRLAQRSPRYRPLLAEIDAGALTLEDLQRIPVTTKDDLIADPAAFLLDGARPHLSTRTTGTTGRPVEIWLSRYETELWPALAALSGLLRDEIHPGDCMQINISSRATWAVQQNMAVCRHAGARAVALGLVSPEASLEGLRSGATLLATYPSYLAELVRAARRRGLGPDDFRLRRIDCGGEVLSRALVDAAQHTLGAAVNDTFAMTEVLPVSGRVCEQGHLHHDLNMGLCEIVALDGERPAAPGELGTVVVTPYYPYRECMPVLRYDTRDLVRRLPDTPLDCSLAGIPGCSRILGKAGQEVRVGERVVTPRALVEACEALPGEPWPARFAARAPGGRLELTLSADTAGALSPAELSERLGADCTVVAAPVRHLRADLRETTFGS